MARSSISFLLLAGVAALLFSIWPGSRSRAPRPADSPRPSPDILSAEISREAPVVGSAPAPAAIPARTESADEESPGPPPLAVNSGALAWEHQLAQAGKTRDATGTARSLFALLPTLPDEALAAAAEQAIARLPDADYAAVALPVLANPRTRTQAMSVLFADLMERPDAITLPALLITACDAAHPFAEPALDNLRLLLRQDFGHDWAKWRTAIEQRLAAPK